MKLNESAITLNVNEADLCRQWFVVVQNLNPAYLDHDNYVLAKKLYEVLEMRIPYSIFKYV